MPQVLHKANGRGIANHGWLASCHSFSFSDYYNPEMMGFGALRVINDDVVAPGRGFPEHPHQNMEIISIPLSGALEHEDSIGHKQILHRDDVQLLSAGTGIMHSEYNASYEDTLSFLQIWIQPKAQDLTPHYDQHDFSNEFPDHGLLAMIGPVGFDAPLLINQDAVVSMACLDGDDLVYAKHFSQNGVYFFVIDGPALIAGQLLRSRDALGVIEEDTVLLSAEGQSRILCLEVPLS